MNEAMHETMNDDSWRSKTADHLRTLARQLHDLAPGIIYGAVSACALLPLVGAAQQGVLPYGAMSALLGDVGVSLVGNLLQSWKDRGEVEQVQALPGELTRLAKDDAAWRTVQDTLLAHFAMLPTLQAAISDDDKAWFAQSMRQALADVGSSVQMNVTVTGSQHVAVGQYVHQVINYVGHPLRREILGLHGLGATRTIGHRQRLQRVGQLVQPACFNPLCAGAPRLAGG